MANMSEFLAKTDHRRGLDQLIDSRSTFIELILIQVVHALAIRPPAPFLDDVAAVFVTARLANP